jgi:ComF family protein
MKENIKNFLLNIFFPKFCFGCQREGTFLCQDCQAILDISNSHRKFQTENLSDLYYPLEYKNPLIKNLIKLFKYEPFVKELAKDFTSLIIAHFQLLDPPPKFGGGDYVLVPVPLEKRKLKWRGFNQAEEVGKEIAKFLKIQLVNNVLKKIKETPPQVELSDRERKENIKGVFLCKNSEQIKGKKILLVDDVYTTGSTLEECAKVLKKAGAKEVIGIVIARAAPGQDQFKNV